MLKDAVFARKMRRISSIYFSIVPKHGLQIPLCWQLWHYVDDPFAGQIFYHLLEQNPCEERRMQIRRLPLLLAVTNLERANEIVLKDEVFSLSRLKRYFVYSLCSWASLVVGSDSLIICKLVLLAGS